MPDTYLIRQEETGQVVRFSGVGRWTIGNAAELDKALSAVAPNAGGRTIHFDMGSIESLDTTGAMLLHRVTEQCQVGGGMAEIVGFDVARQALFDQVSGLPQPPSAVKAGRNIFVYVAEEVGRAVVDFFSLGRDFIAFIGLICVVFGRTLKNPRRLRITSLVFHIEEVGFNALPIVGLLSFLIGIVMAYQGAVQLRQFGADIFVVNLIAISVLRELGVLLTAIVVAGRSGSAFTAQIGSMKLREEIDAMRTLGIDPMEALVLPRLIALIVALPLLGFFADIMGLVGGALLSWGVLDISPAVFIDRLGQTKHWHFTIGMIKAPVFAAIIAAIGCYQGLQVSGSAESVGNRTTRSVVEGIFLVIVVDALFSIFFNLVKV